MEIQKTLADFKGRVDKEIEKYFTALIRKEKGKDFLTVEALEYVKKMTLASGKRLRPALMHFGYLGAGGKEKQKLLRAAVAVELVHMYLLIHDDIIDRDSKRHGVDSLHFHFSKFGRKKFPQKDFAHFGDSMAIIIGDILAAYANEIIAKSDFEPEQKMKVLIKLQNIIATTVMGQAKDVYMEHNGLASEKEILAMYEYKTAKYTVEGPLHLGMLLAGTAEKDLRAISGYAIPIGIAFQIQDDILGIFGSEKKLGKSVQSDIEEGKQTILLAKAFELGNAAQKKELSRIMNAEKVSVLDVKAFRQIVKETGSLEYANNLAKEYINRGKKALSKFELTKEAKDFLWQLADYMLSRSH